MCVCVCVCASRVCLDGQHIHTSTHTHGDARAHAHTRNRKNEYTASSSSLVISPCARRCFPGCIVDQQVHSQEMGMGAPWTRAMTRERKLSSCSHLVEPFPRALLVLGRKAASLKKGNKTNHVKHITKTISATVWFGLGNCPAIIACPPSPPRINLPIHTTAPTRRCL